MSCGAPCEKLSTPPNLRLPHQLSHWTHGASLFEGFYSSDTRDGTWASLWPEWKGGVPLLAEALEQLHQSTDSLFLSLLRMAISRVGAAPLAWVPGP